MTSIRIGMQNIELPTTSRHEDMRLDPSLNVTPEGSLGDLPSAVDHAEEDRM